MHLDRKTIKSLVVSALAEDIGTGDVSADLLSQDKIVNATLVTNDEVVIAGVEYFNQTLLQYDKNIVINWHVNEGDKVLTKTLLCSIKGSAKSLLTTERTALNFLQTLCGTATLTNEYAKRIAYTNTKLLDTRKTIPLLRLAQKQAVRWGGGHNHRIGLYDCVMIKENHISALGGIDLAIKQAKIKHPNLPLVLEVEDLTQLKQALTYSDNITRILCDNFTIDTLSKAVILAAGVVPLEASGDINKDNIASYAATGVDCISVGAITKHIQAINLSLKIID